jgi:hypothetical protein
LIQFVVGAGRLRASWLDQLYCAASAAASTLGGMLQTAFPLSLYL